MLLWSSVFYVQLITSNFHFSLSLSLWSDNVPPGLSQIVPTALHSSHYCLHSLFMQSNKYASQNRHHLLTCFAFVKLCHPLFSVNFWFDTNLSDYDPCLLHHSVALTPSGTYHPCFHNTPKERKKRRKRERENEGENSNLWQVVTQNENEK